MKGRRFWGFIMSLIMIFSSVNVSFGESFGDVSGGIEEESVVEDVLNEGQAVDEGVGLYTVSSTDIMYKVEGGYIYFDESTGTITDCDESVTEAVIPSEINGVSVEIVGYDSFFECENLISVAIPGSVRTIESFAFFGCISLVDVKISNGLEVIGDNSFGSCKSLKNLVLPDSVSKIGMEAFASCSSLVTIKIPVNVKAIEYNTFSGCESLISITIPKNFKFFAPFVFVACNSLKDVYYAGTQEEWKDITKPRKDFIDCLENATIHYNASINDASSMEIASDNPTMSTRPGACTNFCVYYKDGGDVSNITAYTNGSKNIIITDSTYKDNKLFVSVNGLEEGVGYIYFHNKATNETRSVRLAVANRRYAVNYDNVPVIDSEMGTIINGFQGMYIDNYNYSDGDNGFKNLTFDVYNTLLNPAIVSVYNENAELISIQFIDKLSPGNDSIKGALYDNSIKLWNDFWDGNVLTYRQSANYSKKTSVDVNVPKGGYIEITADVSESMALLIADGINMASSVKGLFKSLKGWDADTGKLVGNAILKCQSDEMSKAYAKKLSKKLTNKGFNAVDVSSVLDFVKSIMENLASLDEDEITKILEDAAIDVGFSTGESLLVACSDVFGQALTIGFSIQKVANICCMVNSFNSYSGGGSILIQVPNDYSVGNNGFKVASQSESMSDAALSVYRIDTDDYELMQNEDIRKLIESDVCCYDISLIKGTEVVQPDGEVTVTMPVPEELQPYINSLRVKRVESDGSYTDMNAITYNGTLRFTTDHFSVYMLDLGFDVNNDGITDNKDIGLILKNIAGINEFSDEQKETGDVDNNGTIDIRDAVLGEKLLDGVKNS